MLPARELVPSTTSILLASKGIILTLRRAQAACRISGSGLSSDRLILLGPYLPCSALRDPIAFVLEMHDRLPRRRKGEETGEHDRSLVLTPPASDALNLRDRAWASQNANAIVLRFQADAGNQAVTRMLSPAAKLGMGRTPAPVVQRRLIASGSEADFDRFRALVEPATGVQLSRDPATNVVTMVASLADPATSPALLNILSNIIDDPVQDAEAHFGERQPGVAVGAFPNPNDMTGPTEQRIDLDDIENIEAGAPGNGVAKFAHEIQENYVAHGQLPVAGSNQFPAAHQAGVAAESAVASELVGPGDRVADRDAVDPADANRRTRVQDFQTYYLVFDLTRDPATNDFTVSNARQPAKAQVSQHTVDTFGSNSDAFPPGGAAAAAAVAADLAVAAHPQATVLIDGFTDSKGNPGINDPLSLRRAEAARAAIIAAGAPVGPGAFEVRGRGASNPVAGNATEVDKARNRRVIITVTEPAPP